MIRRLLVILALAPTFIVMPILGVLEHYAGIKMGMYRYVMMKNYWLLSNVFTPEALPFISGMTAACLLLTVLRVHRPAGLDEMPWILWRLYGALMAAGGYYLFDAGRFTSVVAGPWFAMTLLTAEVAWLLGTFCPPSSKRAPE
ncbi:MAG: hypothetical protein IJ702_07560 [Fretibacterium sp.]|nr:hypothetical protein [Fretibacterium sp.]